MTGTRRSGRAAGLLWHPGAALAARALIGGLFLYTGLHKIGHIADLARIIYSYRLLHMEMVNLAAMGLAWLEVLVGGLLLVGLLRRSAAAVATGMLIAFIGAVWLAMVRGIEGPCGCFSTALGSERIGWPVLARDAVLALLSVYLVWNPHRFAELDMLLEEPRQVSTLPSAETRLARS
jgi:uncharacterized membrane protein YphA (DoxX/SURF4 family)